MSTTVLVLVTIMSGVIETNEIPMQDRAACDKAAQEIEAKRVSDKYLAIPYCIEGVATSRASIKTRG